MIPSDAGLAARFRDANDRGAFEALLVRHLASLRRFLAVTAAGDLQIAADAEQRVLFRLYSRLASWRAKGSFTTHLFTLARKASLEAFRQQHRRDLWKKTWNRWKGKVSSPVRPTIPPSPWNLALPGRSLRRALSKLSEAGRGMLYLAEAERCDTVTLATIYGLSEDEVHLQLKNALSRLQALLKEERYA